MLVIRWLIIKNYWKAVIKVERKFKESFTKKKFTQNLPRYPQGKRKYVSLEALCTKCFRVILFAFYMILNEQLAFVTTDSSLLRPNERVRVYIQYIL